MYFALTILLLFMTFSESQQLRYQGSAISENGRTIGRNLYFQDPAFYLHANRYFRHPGGEVRSLDRLGGGEVLRSLDSLNGGIVLKYAEDQSPNDWNNPETPNLVPPRALDRLSGGEVLKLPKRNLDTLSGMTFGESKRFDSLSGATFGQEKRDFDEIDRVGFNQFSKRKQDFNKKNFDEIDHTGFGGFVKRDI
ncbi:orcokinin peptides type A-like [Centruroides sculpturatus]|uniref:orcokinin peptides type A-like n=1 Tax=Centruroides sculpturatus TaxID=218467 RepID=UPI000C6E52EF|nr:orcokinin peptides type A-like [Centruroides sculpturatus]